MEQSFGHMPFALLVQQGRKTSKEDLSLDVKNAKDSKVQSFTPALSKQHSEQTDDTSLFLQAMGSLVHTEAENVMSGIDNHKKYKQPKHIKKFKSPVATGLLPLSESFAQVFAKPVQKKHTPEGSAHTVFQKNMIKKASKHSRAVQQIEDDMTMENLLLSQKAVAEGSDIEGMDAFFSAMKEVSPLAGKGRDIAPEVQLQAPAGQAQDAFALMMEKKLEFALALKGEYMEGHVVGLDEGTMNNLRAGVYSPEAHLDLHGLNAMQAYTAMSGFFKGAWYKGMRTLLLIPGRGKNSPNGVSVLREKVQLWLTQEPFKRVVLAFCTAQPVDGGPGTVYVLLRKYKKKGKVCWERHPSDPDLY